MGFLQRLFKRKTAVPESRAAADFVRAVFDDAKAMLPELCSSVEAVHVELKIAHEPTGALDLSLALLALELEALPNLFPLAQASRLREKVFAALRDENDYPNAEVTAYHDIFRESLQHGLDPIRSVCERLLHRLTHEEASYGAEAFAIHPLAVAVIHAYVVSAVGRWKLLKGRFDIIDD